MWRNATMVFNQWYKIILKNVKSTSVVSLTMKWILDANILNDYTSLKTALLYKKKQLQKNTLNMLNSSTRHSYKFSVKTKSPIIYDKPIMLEMQQGNMLFSPLSSGWPSTTNFTPILHSSHFYFPCRFYLPLGTIRRGQFTNQPTGLLDVGRNWSTWRKPTGRACKLYADSTQSLDCYTFPQLQSDTYSANRWEPLKLESWARCVLFIFCSPCAWGRYNEINTKSTLKSVHHHYFFQRECWQYWDMGHKSGIWSYTYPASQIKGGQSCSWFVRDMFYPLTGLGMWPKQISIDAPVEVHQLQPRIELLFCVFSLSHWMHAVYPKSFYPEQIWIFQKQTKIINIV